MKHLRLAALLLPALFLLLSTAPAGASILRALVAEVPDGATLVVISGNRRLNVVLKGVEAPRDAREAEQARQHLAKLALGREVMIEYTGVRGQSIYGRVVCNGMDLGLQVVRDGAARYDAAPDNTLSAADKHLFIESERAARTERRGVWQAVKTRLGNGRGPVVLAAEESVAPVGAPAAKPAAKPAPSPRRRTRPALSTEDAAINRLANSPAAGKAARGAGLEPKVTEWPLNEPGAFFDFMPYVGRGRKTIVYYYAEWCPGCRKMTPIMQAIQEQYPDIEVLPLDIERWNSPITSAYGIVFIPNFQVYDEGGKLIVAGKPAIKWISDQMGSRGGLMVRQDNQ